ncbi:endothelin-converting enzyme 1 isoform X1 [Amia ocellicauda]|uniref:endothelin-converting enzyme 1 isoform X1 n=1 Tax=Amia ocellicauda TaxID=2972642 RepID=UPI0034641F38
MSFKEKMIDSSLDSQCCCSGSWLRRFTVPAMGLTLIAIAVGLGIYLHSNCPSQSQSDAAHPCLALACQSASARLSASLDPSADRCLDYFQYACGAHLQSRATGGQKRGRNRHIQTETAVQRVLRSILESSNGSGPLDSAQEKASRFYRSCLDTERISVLGAQPVVQLIDKLGGWTVSGRRSDFNQTLQTLMRDYSTFPFFSVYVGRDPRRPNSTRTFIQIDQPALQIPVEWNSKEFSTKKAESVRGLLSHLESLLSLLGVDVAGGATAWMLLSFLSQLSQGARTLPERQRENLLYQPTSLAELQATAPAIDWQGCLNATFHPIKINQSDVIFVHDMPYLIRMSQIINLPLHSGAVQSYMMFSLLLTMAPALDSRFTQARNRLAQAQGERLESSPRWQQCVLQTDRHFGSVLGAQLIERELSEPTLTEADKLIADIFSSLQTRLADLRWRDEEAMKRLLEKIHSLSPRLARYPSINDRDKLYSQVSVTEGEYFKNYLQTLSLSNQRKVRLLTQDTDSLSISPLSVSPSLSGDDIIFPLGMFLQPLFHPDYPRAVKFGTTGTVVARGAMHLLYNHTVEGAFPSGSSPVSLAQCLLLQFHNLTAGGGRGSSEEQWVLHIAFQTAIQAYMSKAAGDFSLSGLSHSQLFLTSFAQMLCGSDSPPVTSDPVFMVNTLCANSALCSRALGCPPDSPLNPQHKCCVAQTNC